MIGAKCRNSVWSTVAVVCAEHCIKTKGDMETFRPTETSVLLKNFVLVGRWGIHTSLILVNLFNVDCKVLLTYIPHLTPHS